MKILGWMGAAFLACSSMWAAAINFPGGVLTIPGTSTTGVSFTYSGTLTQNDTVSFVQTGNPCLQNSGAGIGTAYCVNGAGVLTVAGTGGGQVPGTSNPFVGLSTTPIPTNTYTYGAVIMIISGVGAVQVFPTIGANGLGNSTPPTSLTLPATTLSALGFSSFSVSNPTITFIVGDTFWGDNGGQFVLTQSAPSAVPIPNTLLLGMVAVLCLASAYWMRSRNAHHIG